jgi:predicted metal-dependent HD superfamily phosphohydrolase
MMSSTARSAHELVPGFVAALGAVAPGPQGLAAELADRLLKRWSEPHRRYHAVSHLVATLEAARTVLDADDVPLDAGRAADVVLAVWFHDAVYTGRAGDDEEASAQLAEAELPRLGLPAERVAEVARLVRLTAGHNPAKDDLAGQVLCDADLAVLGATEAVYRAYASAVRGEYAQVPPADFRAGRAAVLGGLGAATPLYRTAPARREWEAAARANLAAELARLADPATPLDGDDGVTPPQTSEPG